MNLPCKSESTAEIGQYFVGSQIMRLCYLMPFLFVFSHKTQYFAEILDRSIELEMQLYFLLLMSLK